MNNNIQTIVYDWNGTLFDDASIVCTCISHVIEQMGYPAVSFGAFQQHFDMPIERLHRGLGVSDKDIQRLTLNRMGVCLENDRVVNFHDLYEPLADKAPLREHAFSLLDKAHSRCVTQVILSNHLVDPIQRQLYRTDTAQFIETILANPSREKQFQEGPKSERLRRYMAENDIRPEVTLIIGDSPEETVIARSLGLTSVALTGGFVSEERLRAAKPDYLFHSLADVIPLLQESEAA